MSLGKTIIIIIIIIGAIWYLAPEDFEKGKSALVDRTKQLLNKSFDNETVSKINKFEFTIQDYGIDFGTIGDLNCSSDYECESFFNIGDMKCSSLGTCFLEVDLNATG